MVLQMPFSQGQPPPVSPPMGVGLPMSPLGMGDPMPPPMPQQMMPPNISAILDLALKPPIQPRYPPGYEKPDKPIVDEIIQRAENAMGSNQEFLGQVADTLNRLRPGSGWGGYFLKDRYSIMQGDMEQYRSPSLIAAHNRHVSYLASRPIAFSVEVYDPEVYQDAQKMEDSAYHFRAMHERRWVNAGNPALSQCEAWDIATYGMVIARHTLNQSDTKCPIKATLIDPATVYPVWGHAGVINELEAVYRIVTMPIYQLLAEYPKNKNLKGKLKDAIGDKIGTFGDSADVSVVEYWDTWWGGAFVLGSGVEIKPLTAHEYGCVPYIIQYGPGGEPMHTRIPNGPGSNVLDYGTYGDSSSRSERTYKATSYIEPFKAQHDFDEAVKSKALHNILKSFDPPRKIERTSAGSKGELPIVEDWAGGMTELEAGEERESLLDQPANKEVGLLFQIMAEDKAANPLSPNYDGMPDKSNISGTARQGMAEVGQEQREMWVRSLESLHAREATHDINKLWRNFGHEARYSEGTKKPFYVPSHNPTEVGERSFELTPEVIDNVDTEIDASMNSLKMTEMVQFAQAMQMMGPDGLGIYTTRDIARKAGVTDFDRVQQDVRTERMIKKVMELEETGKLVLAPQALKQAIREATGNPELQAELQETLDMWIQAVKTPMEAKIQQSMAPPAPPPGPQGPMNPGQGIAGGGGAAYSAMGQGPGSQGGVVGTPPGQREMSGPPMGLE